MILTGAKLEEIGKAVYHDNWVAHLSKRLGCSKRTIMRRRDEERPIPPEWKVALLDLINEQYAILADAYNLLAQESDDAA